MHLTSKALSGWKSYHCQLCDSCIDIFLCNSLNRDYPSFETYLVAKCKNNPMRANVVKARFRTQWCSGVGCSPTGEVATLSERLLVLCIVLGIRCLSGCSFFFFIFLSLSLFPFPFLACCFVWAGRTGLASISVTSRSKGSFYLCQKKTKKKKKKHIWIMVSYFILANK
jgi:hypothetical protein